MITIYPRIIVIFIAVVKIKDGSLHNRQTRWVGGDTHADQCFRLKWAPGGDHVVKIMRRRGLRDFSSWITLAVFTFPLVSSTWFTPHSPWLGLRIECAMLVINFHCYLFLWGQTLMVGVSQNLVPTLLVSPESIIHQPASHLHFGISSPPLLFSLSSLGILIPPILIVWKMQANTPHPILSFYILSCGSCGHL